MKTKSFKKEGWSLMLNPGMKPNMMSTQKIKRPLNLAIQSSPMTSSTEMIIFVFQINH